MNIDTRIIRLEERLRPSGCATCRHWDGTVICDDTGDCHRPERCPNCGREVPYTQIVRLEGPLVADI